MFLKLRASLSSLPKPEDGEKDVRRRRRLSKPLTNKSSSNLLMPSTPQPEDQEIKQSTPNIETDDDYASWSIPLPDKEPRMTVYEHLYKPMPAQPQAKSPIQEEELWKGAASTVVDDEFANANEQAILSPTPSTRKPKRPLSTMFTSFSSARKTSDFIQRRASLQSLADVHLVQNGRDRLSNGLPDSTDNLSEAPPGALYRRSSFAPGVATRNRKAPSLEPAAEEELSKPEDDDDSKPSCADESPLSQLEVLDFDEEWTPPAQPAERTATPTDLDYTHLGGLRLGSLRVVNGRASPAPSELSRHLGMGPTSNHKRYASSEYGDSQDTDLPTLATLRQTASDGQTRATAEARLTHTELSKAPSLGEYLQPSKRGNALVNRIVVGTLQNDERSTSISVHDEAVLQTQTSPQSPDRTSFMAMEYMAEISGSPYSIARSISPTGSVLISTSKTTEFDDQLFDDEFKDLSSDEADHMSLGSHYSSNSVHGEAMHSNIEPSAESSQRSSLQPAKSTGSLGKPDSGYGSKISLQSLKNQKTDLSDQPATHAPGELPSSAESHDTTASDQESSRDHSSLVRPSILKRSESTPLEIPAFSNLHLSTTSLVTIKSTTSAMSDASSKSRKLQKRRPLSQPPPVNRITVQGHQDITEFDVPPIPAQIAANLAIRSEQVPELDRTFTSMQDTRGTEESTKPARTSRYIDFPDPHATTHASEEEIDQPSPPPRRSSFMKWTRNNATKEADSSLPSARRSSFMKWSKDDRRSLQRRTSSGISESDAMAIIQDRDSELSILERSPYEIASRTLRPANPTSREPMISMNPNRVTKAPPRPRKMMDDATASELARLRSRTIVERDNMKWNSKRISFNDRGGVPGKNMRPISFAGTVPPLPPLPKPEDLRQRETREADYHQTYAESPATKTDYCPCPEQLSSDPYENPAPPPASHAPPQQIVHELEENPAPPPPSHFPQPKSIEPLEEYAAPPPQQIVHELEENPAPPPPSHSPQPKSIEPLEEYAAPPPPSHSSRPNSIQSYEELLAPPPPSHSPRPMDVGPQEVQDVWATQALAWKSRRESVGEILRSTSTLPVELESQQPSWAHESAVDDSIYPEIPLRRAHTSFVDESEHYRHSPPYYPAPHHGYRQRDTLRKSQPSYGPFVNDVHNRPRSRASQVPSLAGSHISLADRLHQPQQPRPYPCPSTGRYSGGLNYDYQPGLGFGGSAGIRSTSGTAKAARKGIPLSERGGVDLSDVPFIVGIRRKPVGF